MIDSALHPREQEKLFGHYEALEQLRQAWQRDQMPYAWLVSGPKGIGKATFIYSFVREILSAGHPDPIRAKAQLKADTYPNLLSLEVQEDAKEISAEQTRQVAHFLSYTAAQPGWRIVVVDSIDEMNRFSANALLKVVEEPPAQSVFFFVTHALGNVLPTVRSRCRVLPLQPLCVADLQSQDENIEALLPLVGGSLGRAYMLQSMGGLPLIQKLLEAIQAALYKQWGRVQPCAASIVDGLPKGAASIAALWDVLLELLRRFVHSAHTERNPDAPQTRVTRLSATRSSGHWVAVYEQISTILPRCYAAHLDSTQLLVALLMIMDDPQLSSDWARGLSF